MFIYTLFSLKCINILFYVLLKSWPNLEAKQFTIGFDSWFGQGTPFLFFFFCPIRFTIWTIVIMVFNIKFLNLKSTSTKTSLRVVHVCFGLMLGFWFCRNFCSLSCDSDSMSRDSLWIYCFASTLWEKSLFFAYDFGICSLTHSPTGDLSQHLYFRFPFPFFNPYSHSEGSGRKFEVFDPEYYLSCCKGTGLLEYPSHLTLSNLIFHSLISFPKWVCQTWTNP